MRIIDRLIQYISAKKITPHSFEKNCDVSNGYLMKQQKGKGSIGSDILERVHNKYPDMDFMWLMTGKGDMLVENEGLSENYMLGEKRPNYSKDEHILFLSGRITLLQTSLADKEKIIALLEKQLSGSGQKK